MIPRPSREIDRERVMQFLPRGAAAKRAIEMLTQFTRFRQDTDEYFRQFATGLAEAQTTVEWLGNQRMRRTGIREVDQALDDVFGNPVFDDVLREVNSFFFKLQDVAATAQEYLVTADSLTGEIQEIFEVLADQSPNGVEEEKEAAPPSSQGGLVAPARPEPTESRERPATPDVLPVVSEPYPGAAPAEPTPVISTPPKPRDYSLKDYSVLQKTLLPMTVVGPFKTRPYSNTEILNMLKDAIEIGVGVFRRF